MSSMKQSDVLKSTSYDQAVIIKDIIKLHIPSGIIDCDTTYSIGNFYKATGVEAPKYKFDIFPQAEGVEQASADKLPLEDNSIDSIMFDPPFVISQGPSLKPDTSQNAGERRNVIHNRFSSFESPKKLWEFYKASLEEGYRVLNNNGVFIFKCQDTVNSGKNFFSHSYVMNLAVKAGFYPKDLFILLAKSRIISGKHLNQQHARKYHSYFWVFEKNTKGKNINYFE